MGFSVAFWDIHDEDGEIVGVVVLKERLGGPPNVTLFETKLDVRLSRVYDRVNIARSEDGSDDQH